MTDPTFDAGRRAAVDYMDTHYPDRKWAIVGGMLRDERIGRPYKDIDIFVHGYDTDLLPTDAHDGDANAFLLRAHTVEHFWYGGVYEINLIFMRGEWTTKRLADRCDLGFCQIAWTPSEGLYESDAYIADMANNTMTLYRATSRDHVDRMRMKFPYREYLNPQNIPVGGDVYWEYNETTRTLDKLFKFEGDDDGEISHTIS